MLDSDDVGWRESALESWLPQIDVKLRYASSCKWILDCVYHSENLKRDVECLAHVMQLCCGRSHRELCGERPLVKVHCRKGEGESGDAHVFTFERGIF